MAAPHLPTHTNRRDEVTFAPNIPVTLALKYAQGRNVSGRNGERVMFTTADNRVLFLDLEVAARIEQLGIQPGELMRITKAQLAANAPAAWTVERAMGEQPNGTFVAPAPPPGVPSPRPMATATAAQPSAREALVAEANMLVDSFAEVLDRAAKLHGSKIESGEVRALLLSAYIQRRQLSSVA